MIRQVVSNPIGRYELTNEMRGHAFAIKDKTTFMVIYNRDANIKGKYEAFYYLIPLLSNRSVTLKQEISKTKLLDEYQVFVATTEDDSKRLIKELLV